VDIEVRLRLPPGLSTAEIEELAKAHEWILERHGTKKAASQSGRVALVGPPARRAAKLKKGKATR
jgi:hypothetical protein